jgi:DNA repair exonuclease SbcCD ATPase subunit/DNA repair exonuclease SbcCD nuclease subunit
MVTDSAATETVSESVVAEPIAAEPVAAEPIANLVTDSATITHIYHLADIHIRLQMRHDEYKQVFENLYTTLRSEPNIATSVIVICGDILHSKNTLSPELIVICRNFFTTLSTIAPTFVIAGNHDANLNNRSQRDALGGILHNATSDRLRYLRDSGYYDYHNVKFVLNSVFPSPWLGRAATAADTAAVRQIGLYHGPVCSARTDVGHILYDERTIDDFDGLDLVLLGDIHRFQYLNEKKTIAYPGSLIQQNHGEGLRNHGMIRWSLEDLSSVFIEIENKYGYVTIVDDGSEIGSATATMTALDMAIRSMPEFVYLRIKSSDTTDNRSNAITARLVAGGKTVLSTSKIYDTQLHSARLGRAATNTSGATDAATAASGTKSLIGSNDVTTHMETFENYVMNTLKSAESTDRYDSIMKLHRQVVATSGAATASGGASSGAATRGSMIWELGRLEFDNYFCFGEGNVIDFRECNGIVGILASNYSGKSSIIDILLFTLFDECSRGDRNSVINANSTHCRSRIQFFNGDTEYWIERQGRKTPKNVKFDVDFGQYLGAGGRSVAVSLNANDRVETNAKIRELIGSYDDFITTNVSLQRQERQFIDLSSPERKRFLQTLMGLDRYDDYHAAALAEIRANKGTTKALELNLMGEMRMTKEVVRTTKMEDYVMLSNGIDDTNATNSSMVVDIVGRVCERLEQSIKVKTTALSAAEDVHRELRQTHTRLVESFDRRAFQDKTASEQLIESERQLRQLSAAAESAAESAESAAAETAAEPVSLETIQADHRAFEERRAKSISDIELRQRELKTLIGTDTAEPVPEPVWNESLYRQFCVIQRDKVSVANEIAVSVANEIAVSVADANEIAYPTNRRKTDLFLAESAKNLASSTMVGLISTEEQLNQSIEAYKASTEASVKLEQLRRQLKQIDATRESLERHEYDPMCRFCTSNPFVVDARSRLGECDTIMAKIAELESVVATNIDGDRLAILVDIHNRNVQQMRSEKLMTERKLLYDSKSQYRLESEAAAESIRTLSKMTDVEFDIRIANYHKIEKIRKCRSDIETSKARVAAHEHHLELNRQITAVESELRESETKISSEKESISNQIRALDRLRIHATRIREIRVSIDELDAKTALWTQYSRFTDKSGYPHTLVQSTIPRIKDIINRLLSATCGFVVELVWTSKEIKVMLIRGSAGAAGTAATSTAATSTAAGSTAATSTSYEVDLCSGYERFMINLSFRLTWSLLGDKPRSNALFIDEGWGAFDEEHLADVGIIFNFLQQFFKFVIVITHVSELREHLTSLMELRTKTSAGGGRSIVRYPQ